MNEPMTMGRLRQLTKGIPDEAKLHGYLHQDGFTVQAEWTAVEDEHGGGVITNPVILRVPLDIHAGGAAAEPEWAQYVKELP